MPPIWEYTRGGYRAPRRSRATSARSPATSALDLLFTSSPLYPPYLTPPDLPHSDQHRLQHLRGHPRGGRLRPVHQAGAGAGRALASCSGRTRFSYDNQDLPFTGEALQCYELWLEDVTCYPELDYPAFANLFLYNALNLERTQDDAGRVDYELPNFNYAATDELSAGLLGFADDNYRDRHAELRLQLRLPGHRRGRLRPDHDDDPRGRPPPGHEPPARRLRLGDRHRLRAHGRVLLRLVGRREQLDHELHRPELGLQPVRPRQHEPLHGGRVRPLRQPGRGRRPGRPRRRPGRRRAGRRRQPARRVQGWPSATTATWRPRSPPGRPTTWSAREPGRPGCRWSAAPKAGRSTSRAASRRRASWPRAPRTTRSCPHRHRLRR